MGWYDHLSPSKSRPRSHHSINSRGWRGHALAFPRSNRHRRCFSKRAGVRFHSAEGRRPYCRPSFTSYFVTTGVRRQEKIPSAHPPGGRRGRRRPWRLFGQAAGHNLRRRGALGRRFRVLKFDFYIFHPPARLYPARPAHLVRLRLFFPRRRPRHLQRVRMDGFSGRPG